MSDQKSQIDEQDPFILEEIFNVLNTVLIANEKQENTKSTRDGVRSEIQDRIKDLLNQNKLGEVQDVVVVCDETANSLKSNKECLYVDLYFTEFGVKHKMVRGINLVTGLLPC